MKNRILKRSIALIISVILVIQTAGAVFAEPSETVSGDGNAAAASEEITVSENLQKEASEVTENEPEQPEAADAGTEEAADEEPADEQCADTPEETVNRARERIGETSYNLWTNNCEHFAIWCKTGISESHQIEDVLNAMAETSRQIREGLQAGLDAAADFAEDVTKRIEEREKEQTKQGTNSV